MTNAVPPVVLSRFSREIRLRSVPERRLSPHRAKSAPSKWGFSMSIAHFRIAFIRRNATGKHRGRTNGRLFWM
jgi:hypothetical protein